MSFNESNVRRDGGGKFDTKTGSTADVTLSGDDIASVVDAPSLENGWLLPGKECECDVDYTCPNHDTEAEARYFSTRLAPEPVKVRDAHGFDDRWDDVELVTSDEKVLGAHQKTRTSPESYSSAPDLP